MKEGHPRRNGIVSGRFAASRCRRNASEELLERFRRFSKTRHREHHYKAHQQSGNADRRQGQQVGVGDNRNDAVPDPWLLQYPPINRVDDQSFSPSI
jgi:hypothetical protein